MELSFYEKALTVLLHFTTLAEADTFNSHFSDRIEHVQVTH